MTRRETRETRAVHLTFSSRSSLYSSRAFGCRCYAPPCSPSLATLFPASQPPAARSESGEMGREPKTAVHFAVRLFVPAASSSRSLVSYSVRYAGRDCKERPIMDLGFQPLRVVHCLSRLLALRLADRPSSSFSSRSRRRTRSERRVNEVADDRQRRGKDVKCNGAA